MSHLENKLDGERFQSCFVVLLKPSSRVSSPKALQLHPPDRGSYSTSTLWDPRAFAFTPTVHLATLSVIIIVQISLHNRLLLRDVYETLLCSINPVIDWHIVGAQIITIEEIMWGDLGTISSYRILPRNCFQDRGNDLCKNSESCLEERYCKTTRDFSPLVWQITTVLSLNGTYWPGKLMPLIRCLTPRESLM